MSGGDKLERHKRGLITNAWFYLPLASAHCMLLLTTCFCLLHTSANRILLLTACFCLLHASAYCMLLLTARFGLMHASAYRTLLSVDPEIQSPMTPAFRRAWQGGRNAFGIAKAEKSGNYSRRLETALKLRLPSSRDSSTSQSTGIVSRMPPFLSQTLKQENQQVMWHGVWGYCTASQSEVF